MLEASCIIDAATADAAVIEAAADADEAAPIDGLTVDAGNNNIPLLR